MAADGVQRLDLKDLDALLVRAKDEGWTELALLGLWRPGTLAQKLADKLIREGWSADRVFLFNEELDRIPPTLASLTGLNSLDLWGNQIGNEGAKAIASLTGLTWLDLANNRIGVEGAKAIANLTRLTSLDLADNQIGDEGAKAVASLIRLTSLNLRSNQIGDAGAKAIASLTGLTSLELANNQIGGDGAKAIASLTGLTSLELHENQIGDDGAEAIASLSGLTCLHLGSNLIGDAGVGALANLSSLQVLDLYANEISAHGARELSKLPKLTSLDLGLNNRGIGDTGAEALGQSLSLFSLNVGTNLIGDAGAIALARLPCLAVLNLSANSISPAGARAVLNAWADPATAGRRQHLDLSYNGNIGGLLPAEVLAQTDAQALIAAWRRFQEAEAAGELRPLNEAKVLVVGNEAVGKTSLVRFLVDGLARDESEKKTPGIVIRRDVPIADWSEVGSEIRLHFWDFGGQEIMHQTHRYFLTRRSLYLLVLEDRREDDRSIYDWLKVIRSRGGESPVVVVINKCDDGAANLRLDETAIRAAHPNVVAFMPVSCNSGAEERIAWLRRLIAELAVADPRLTHVRDPFPREQLRVKREIVETAAMRSYLSRAEFVRICETAYEPALRVLDPNLQHALLQLLHDLGTVVAHGLERQRSAVVREVTLLDPNWLTEAIYKLLNSKRILDQGGAFDGSDMATELDPERFPPERHGYIVEMMQEPEIGLCFRLPGQGEPRWLMPECLPTVGPDVAGFFEGALRFRFTYDFLPAGLVPRFIVEAYNKFTDQPTRWRTGALLEVSGCPVLVRGDLERHRIDLAVTGFKARRRSALAAVLHDLMAVHKLNPEIGTEARVPLADQPEVDVSYEHLLQLEAEEGAAYSFRPEKAKRKYTVGELLAGVRSEAGLPMPKLALIQPLQPSGFSATRFGWADYNLWALGSGSILGVAATLAAWSLGVTLLLSIVGGLVAFAVVALHIRSRNPDTVLPRLLGMLGIVGAALLYHAMGPRFEISLPDVIGGGFAAIGSSQHYWPLLIWLVAFALVLFGYVYALKMQSKP